MRAGRFASDGEAANGKVTLRLVGDADLAVVARMRELLGELRAEARRVAAAEVVVDVRRLEWMTAGCFSTLVEWISEVRETGACRVSFLSDPRHAWQRRTLRALQCFAPAQVSIVE